MRDRRRRQSRGASLVEFGLVAPVLFMLLFGIIEFGWAFLQFLDVRHGAREGARLAAVNYGTAAEIVSETCGRMDSANGATVTVDFDVAGENDLGDEAVVTVRTDLNTLTGFFDSMLGAVDLESSVHTRLEQDADWSTYTGTCP